MPYNITTAPLNPEVKTALEALYASDWRDPSLLTPVAAREQSRRFAEMRVFPKELPAIATKDIKIPSKDHHTIAARLYSPQQPTGDGALIFFHGGGYVVGNVEQYNPICNWLCAELNMPLISVDYRLSPEFPFPTPIEDGYAALEWITHHAVELGWQDKKIIVGGDSAGGHLAAMISILARDRQGPAIAGQWLLYPWVDDDFASPSYQNYADGFALSKAAMQWFSQQFLAGNHQTNYPAFPLHADNLTNLPPAYIITAECDVLHDEGEKYAEKLKAAGNVVHAELAPGMIHGFLSLYPIPACYQAMTKIIATVKNSLLV